MASEMELAEALARSLVEDWSAWTEEPGGVWRHTLGSWIRSDIGRGSAMWPCIDAGLSKDLREKITLSEAAAMIVRAAMARSTDIARADICDNIIRDLGVGALRSTEHWSKG